VNVVVDDKVREQDHFASMSEHVGADWTILADADAAAAADLMVDALKDQLFQVAVPDLAPKAEQQISTFHCQTQEGHLNYWHQEEIGNASDQSQEMTTSAVLDAVRDRHSYLK
jgi:hypothetical protein